MNIRLALLASVAFAAFSLNAQASDLTYTITGGTLVDGSLTGSFSGTFLINPSGEVLDGGSLTVIAPTGGPVYSFFANAPSNPTIGGYETFNDGHGDMFTLALNGSLSTLALNTLTSNPGGPGADTYFINAAGARYDATGGAVAPAPEPSSLMLLGTGALGLAGSFRRRWMNR